MSHCACAVFSDDGNEYSFDKLLEPYDENDTRYYTFHELTDEDLVRRLNDSIIECNGRYGIMYNDNAIYDYYTLDGKEYCYDLNNRPKYDNKEMFLHKNDYIYNENNIPYYFITPDGVLHKPGIMGWFACDTSTEDSWKEYVKEWFDYINNKEINPYVSFTDIHI